MSSSSTGGSSTQNAARPPKKPRRSTSKAVLSTVASALNTQYTECRARLKKTQKEIASINHENMRMIINNQRTKLMSLVMRRNRGYWRVADPFGGKPTTFMGITTRLSQLFFNSTEQSHFNDTEDITPITVGPIMANSEIGDARNEVVHSDQHKRKTTHRQPRIARDTSNRDDADDIHSSDHCKCRGIEHGRLVHEELMQLILQWNGCGQMSVRLDHSEHAPQRLHEYDDDEDDDDGGEDDDDFSAIDDQTDNSNKNHRRPSFDLINGLADTSEPDWCTLKVMQYLGCNSLFPLRAELPVFCRQCRTGTAVDIVALDLKTWRVVFIEVKTGYAGAIGTPGCFTGHSKSGKMRNALAGIDDTPLQRAAAQLLGSYLLLVMGERYDRGFGTIVAAPQEMYILHVNPRTIKPIRYAMPNWTYDTNRIAAMYENMCAAARLEMQPPRTMPVHSNMALVNNTRTPASYAYDLPDMGSLMDVHKRKRSSSDDRELKRRQREVQEARELGLY